MKNMHLYLPARAQRGFTLIEVMIVVAVIGIIAAIAYPSYQDSIVKSKRGEAKSCLLEYTQFMERQYATNASYLVAGAAPALPTLACARGGKYYAYSFTAAPNAPTLTTYTLQAVPQATQQDKRCGTLTLNQAGTKTEGGTATDVRDCW